MLSPGEPLPGVLGRGTDIIGYFKATDFTLAAAGKAAAAASPLHTYRLTLGMKPIACACATTLHPSGGDGVRCGCIQACSHCDLLTSRTLYSVRVAASSALSADKHICERKMLQCIASAAARRITQEGSQVNI